MAEMRSYVNAEVDLRAGDGTWSFLESIRKTDNADLILADMADELTSLLKHCLELFSITDDANSDQDPSLFHQPSIESHEQNKRYHSWTALIELCRDAFLAMEKV